MQSNLPYMKKKKKQNNNNNKKPVEMKEANTKRKRFLGVNDFLTVLQRKTKNEKGDERSV